MTIIINIYNNITDNINVRLNYKNVKNNMTNVNEVNPFF